MKIYERDYTVLTELEKEEWEGIKQKETIFINGKQSKLRRNLFREYPKAVRHFLSIFPNNYLDILDLKDEKRLNKLNESYLTTLNNPDTNERTLLQFIKDNQAYFIVASLLKSNYNFGHHGTYIIPEFMLGNSYKVDYLLIGKSSGGYEFVFVELEKPYGNITIGDGELGDAFRKGLKQIEDWETWLEANYTSLYETFIRYKHPEMLLEDEFRIFDRTRMHFSVVAGRRDDFKNKTYRLKRRMKEEQKITLFHYDNLYDNAKNIIGQPSY
jgi:hypothetical protein